jgi:peptidoglycan/LPS O-acetylase OafA/YrhL
MNSSYSIPSIARTPYLLQSARIIATLMVLVGHALHQSGLAPGLLNHLHIGRDGVIVFFLLSGYVISW